MALRDQWAGGLILSRSPIAGHDMLGREITSFPSSSGERKEIGFPLDRLPVPKPGQDTFSLS